MNKILCIVIFILSVFLSSVSQIFLKKSSNMSHKNKFFEYFNWRVILGYSILLICTVLTMVAYKGISLGTGAILESLGYVFVTIFGLTIFKEKMNKIKFLGLIVLIFGIVLFAI